MGLFSKKHTGEKMDLDCNELKDIPFMLEIDGRDLKNIVNGLSILDVIMSSDPDRDEHVCQDCYDANKRLIKNLVDKLDDLS